MRTACARMVQSCFYHTASPLNELRTAQWAVLPSLRRIHLCNSFPAPKAPKAPAFRSNFTWPIRCLPASSASTQHNNVSFSTVAPLPAFLSSCSDQVAACLLTLGKDDVHIWWLRHHHQHQNIPSGTSSDLGSICGTLLSAEEAAECATSSDSASQELRLIARAFTRSVLSRYIGNETTPASLSFERNEHGKPEITHPKASLRFNLTHTPGLVGVAVTNGAAVGLDAESIFRKTKGNTLKLAQRRFAEPEIKQLKSLEEEPEAQSALFIKLWTLKEAYVKAIGKGIGAPPGLRGFSFLLNEASSELLFDPKLGENHPEANKFSNGDTYKWQFALMQPVEGHLAAVCCEKIVDGKARNNSSPELRITSFITETDSNTGGQLMTPRILATGSST